MKDRSFDSQVSAFWGASIRYYKYNIVGISAMSTRALIKSTSQRDLVYSQEEQYQCDLLSSGAPPAGAGGLQVAGFIGDELSIALQTGKIRKRWNKTSPQP